MTLASRRACGVAVLVATALLFAAATPAHAQAVEAEALFREGKRLMKDGKIAEACDKLDASDRIEPSVGTMLNAADCREQNHQLATAWATFLKASAAAKQAGNDAKREAEARRRAVELEPRLAYLTISVPDAARVEGLTIKRNGALVDPALWNQGVPVDAGTYQITGQAPGLEPWSTTVTITAEAQKASVEVPRFKRLEDLQPAVKPETPPPPPVAVSAPVPADRMAPPEPEHDDGGHLTGLRKAAIATAVVGVGGVVVGAIFGVKANNLEKQSDATCPTAACGNQMALQQNHDAQSDATIANIGIIGGGALVAGAAVMWFLGAPRHEHAVSVAPIVRGDQVGLAVGGSF